jgi:hypothetical protein
MVECRRAGKPDHSRPYHREKRALAGIELLKGSTQYKALLAAGYAPATARAPHPDGPRAKACLEEAKKLDLGIDSATLVTKARRALGKKLDQLNDNITEKYHGARGGDSDIDPRQWADRTEWMMTALTELKRRQLEKVEPQDVVD